MREGVTTFFQSANSTRALAAATRTSLTSAVTRDRMRLRVLSAGVLESSRTAVARAEALGLENALPKALMASSTLALSSAAWTRSRAARSALTIPCPFPLGPHHPSYLYTIGYTTHN